MQLLNSVTFCFTNRLKTGVTDFGTVIAFIKVKGVERMRRILCMSHGPLAKGMLETLKFIVGDVENIDTLCAYVDGNNDVEQMIDRYLSQNSENELIVLTDIFGGSINNEWLKRLPKLENVYLVSGVNLSLLVEIYLKSQTATTFKLPEVIDHAIHSSSEAMKFCNRLNYEQVADEF